MKLLKLRVLRRREIANYNRLKVFEKCCRHFYTNGIVGLKFVMAEMTVFTQFKPGVYFSLFFVGVTIVNPFFGYAQITETEQKKQ
jgi:hypothetical protein